MIDFLPYVQLVNWSDAKQYAGIKFSVAECCGELCKRNDHPNDKANLGNHRCSWYEDSLVSEQVKVQKKGQFGKLEDVDVWLPIRYFNFVWAVEMVEERYPLATTFEKLQKAIQYAKLNCFDPTGVPNNLATRFGFTSYSKFLHERSYIR